MLLKHNIYTQNYSKFTWALFCQAGVSFFVLFPLKRGNPLHEDSSAKRRSGSLFIGIPGYS